MTIDVSRFESIGTNCEVGFVLEALLNHEATLMKWAEAPRVGELAALLERDFEGLFRFENIVPFNEGMVFDESCKVAWHSPIRSEVADPAQPYGRLNMRFAQPEAERRALWEDHAGKIAHFVGKFREAARAGGRIYILKPRLPDTISFEEAERVRRALRAYGDNDLLFVTLGDDPGSVRRTESGMLVGHLDRFAPGSATNDFSGGAWAAILNAATAATDRIDP